MRGRAVGGTALKTRLSASYKPHLKKRQHIRNSDPTPLPDKSRIDIGSVDHGVAAGAGCKLLRSRVHSMDRVAADSAMALVAQSVDRRHVQQSRVLRAVGRVASHATFSLDYRVLEDERSTHIGMALDADHILIGSRSELRALERAVDVMAVAALDCAFQHRMVKRHIECALHIGVAGKAKRRLRQFQQGLLALRSVNAMAADAAQARLGVRRAIEIRMDSSVATLTGGVCLFGRRFARQENLGDVSATLDVRLPRSVAALAGDAFAAVLQGKLRMRIVRKVLADLCVTSDTGVGAHIAGCGSCGCAGEFGVHWLVGRVDSRPSPLRHSIVRGVRYPAQHKEANVS